MEPVTTALEVEDLIVLESIVSESVTTILVFAKSESEAEAGDRGDERSIKGLARILAIRAEL